MNNNLEFEDESPEPDSIEDNYPRTNYEAGFGEKMYSVVEVNNLLEEYTNRIVENAMISEDVTHDDDYSNDEQKLNEEGRRIITHSGGRIRNENYVEVDKDSITSQLEIFKKEIL